MPTANIAPGVDWVGALDWTVRDFHSFSTFEGATYNAYLVQDQKNILIDTVKESFADTLLQHISSLLSLERLDYVLCQHAEPDHGGALARVMAACPQATILCNRKTEEILRSYHPTANNWRFQNVTSGESLSLGKRSLTFVEVPMVHWPDSMVSYMPEEGLLFSNDAFGQHYASSGRFDDQSELNHLLYEAKVYYANIVMPFSAPVAKALNGLSGLKLNQICPSHGVIWRKHVAEILTAYQDWHVTRAQAKIVIAYDTMWESTARLAQAILDGATADGVNVKFHHVRKTSFNDIVTDCMDAAAYAFGSPAMNVLPMPTMVGLLSYLKGLKPLNKKGLAFGSYGWSRGGAEGCDAALRDMRVEIIREPISVKWRPKASDLETAAAAGRQLAAIALSQA